MRFTGEIALALAERYGLMIQKIADEREGKTSCVPLEDAREILAYGDPDSIFVETEPDLAELRDEG